MKMKWFDKARVPFMLLALGGFVNLAGGHEVWAAAAVPTNPYAGLDVNFGVFQHMQFEMASGISLSPDGYVSFKSVAAPPAGSGIYMDPVYYVAAWKFCDYLTSKDSTPVNSKTLTAESLKTLMAETTGQAMESVASAKCFQEVAYRTACPQSAAGALTLGTTGGTTCFSQQQAMCHHLSDPIPDGLGISDIGDPDANLALKNCDKYGLSAAMFDKIYANRTHDLNYAANMSAAVGGDVGKAEALAAGDKSSIEFQQMIEQRLASLVVAINLKANYENGLKLDKQNQMVAEQNNLLKEQANKLALIISHESPVVADK